MLRLVVCSLVITTILMHPVAAMPAETVIRANCHSVQSILNQLEKVDAALRINRGRVYNEVLELFYAMNSRLASNRITAVNLATITQDFEDELAEFRELYNKYDDDLTEIISFKCYDEPTKFYDKIVNLRSERKKLNNSVIKLDELADKYQAEFDDKIKGQLNNAN